MLPRFKVFLGIGETLSGRSELDPENETVG
jgi:hypothetical protein